MELGDKAKKMLVAMSESRGELREVRFDGGISYQTPNGKFSEGGTGREEADWRLVLCGLMAGLVPVTERNSPGSTPDDLIGNLVIDCHGGTYKLTPDGWKVADTLKNG